MLDEEIKTEVSDILSGAKEITSKTVHDFDESIKPEFVRAFEVLEKNKKKAQKEKEGQTFDRFKERIDNAISSACVVNDVNLVSCILGDADTSMLRKLSGYSSKKAKNAVVILGASSCGKAYLTCAVTKDIAGKGIDACQIISQISSEIGGTGGGSSEFAQAGGKKSEGLEKAIEKAKNII